MITTEAKKMMLWGGFSGLSGVIIAGNIWMFDNIRHIHPAGFLMTASEILAGLFIFWAGITGLLLKGHPITSLVLIISAAWVWIDRATLTAGYLL